MERMTKKTIRYSWGQNAGKRRSTGRGGGNRSAAVPDKSSVHNPEVQKGEGRKQTEKKREKEIHALVGGDTHVNASDNRGKGGNEWPFGRGRNESRAETEKQAQSEVTYQKTCRRFRKRGEGASCGPKPSWVRNLPGTYET